MKHFFNTNSLAAVAMTAAALLASCSRNDDESKEFHINGVWELQQVTDYEGNAYHYPNNGLTWIRIYDDSCYYSCQQTTAPNGTIVNPAGVENYTYIYKGMNNVLYLEGDYTHPLTIVDDSTMIIQETGNMYKWKVCKNYDPKRCREIVDVIKRDSEDEGDEAMRYVFSNTEDALQTENHMLVYILMLVMVAFMLFMNYAYNLYKNKRRVEQELQRIEQERESLPEPVRQAMDTVEDEFHQSDFYVSLRKRISNGERLTMEDWDAVDTHVQSVYPGFSSKLFSLYNMTPVEYHVCLLLKLNVPPSEIAVTLCKDTSSISSIRSRLYKKVFDKKGSSKDWDKFIVSL